MGSAQRGSREGQATTPKIFLEWIQGPETPSLRLSQSVRHPSPLLGKVRQCPLASLCLFQGSGLSCWPEEKVFVKEPLPPDSLGRN